MCFHIGKEDRVSPKGGCTNVVGTVYIMGFSEHHKYTDRKLLVLGGIPASSTLTLRAVCRPIGCALAAPLPRALGGGLGEPTTSGGGHGHKTAAGIPIHLCMHDQDHRCRYTFYIQTCHKVFYLCVPFAGRSGGACGAVRVIWHRPQGHGLSDMKRS